VGEARKKRVLNAGSGPVASVRLREFFSALDYDEVRLDIDASVKPDLVGSICEMRGQVADASFDAIWSSHSLEHLHAHEAPIALAEFCRVLQADGFVIVTCPNVAAAARLLETEDIENVVYHSAAGPVRILDILYGHTGSIELGRVHMAHRTGFTAARLGRLGSQAGFVETRVLEGDDFDLWAAMLMPRANCSELARRFAATGIATLFQEDSVALLEEPVLERSRLHVRRQLIPVEGG
jgi:SAM-dependent methyltransferase